MRVIKSAVGVGALFLLIGMFLFGACERNITQVVENDMPASCFGCHSDVDTRLVTAEGQWQNSKHASGETTLESDGTCAGCHTSQGFVAKIEGHPVDVVERASAINCFTCHAPHSTGNFGLRVTEAWTLENGESYDFNSGNICVSCHHSRRNVNTYVKDDVAMTSRFGPHHGPQGDVLVGTGGWEFEGATYAALNRHRSLTNDGCLDCHMAQNNYFLGGHSFNMTPLEGEEEGYNINGCDVEACHGGEIEDLDDGFNRLIAGTTTGFQDSVLTLMEILGGLLQDADLLSASGSPVSRDVATADSAGAVYNYMLVKEDRSGGIHNPDYIMDILHSSIEFMTPPPTNSPPAEGATISRR